MISFSWSDAIPDDLASDLADLIGEAVSYDAEAGFSTADPTRPASEGAELHHLLVTMPPRGSRRSAHLDRLPDVGVVAYLRLEVVGGTGEACFVVRPAFRSLGVATLMMERLLDEPEGWATIDGLRRLRAWSHSAHPAAERMARRFGAVARREIFKTLRLVGGRHPFEPASSGAVDRQPLTGAEELAPFHDLGIAPADQRMRNRVNARLTVGTHTVDVGCGVEGEFEAPALIDPHWSGQLDKDDVRATLDTALVEAQSTGARLAALYVDADDELVLHVSREVEFFHDQSDRLYEVTLAAPD